MGILRHKNTGRRVSLGQRCIVGRSAAAHLRLQESTVSGEHACLYFAAGEWKLRDLASLNGTRQNEVRVKEGKALSLREGDSLQFGDTASESWMLESAKPPGPSALVSESRVAAEGSTLWLPSADEPQACLSLINAQWTLEYDDQLHPAVDGETVSIGGLDYQLELPEMSEVALPSTAATSLPSGAETFTLLFTVSADEEHIDLRAHYLGREIALGARAHNEALLALARRSIEELSAGTEPAEAGWMYIEDFWKLLGHDREKLNLQLWRARQHLTRNQLPGETLIERRPDSRQIRIGLPARIQKTPS